ncbi:MAG: SpoIIE family protein phosphatase [Thermoanaerobaculia bacterium]
MATPVLALVPRPGATPGLPTIEPGPQPLRIGREGTCDIPVRDLTVSRRHAQVSWADGKLVVEDLGSSGGTFVNELRIDRAELRKGDVLRLGPRIEWEVVDRSGRESFTSSLSILQSGTAEDGVRQLQTLLEVARALNAATVLDEVLLVVLQAVTKLFSADQAQIVLTNEENQRVAAAAVPESFRPAADSLESSLINEAISSRRTVARAASADATDSMEERGVAEAVATPLLVAHRPMGSGLEASFVAKIEVLGAVLVERLKARGGFKRSELSVFETLAADAAVAIDSARLYREARDKAKIEHEMALARTIQSALLKRPPTIPFAEVACFFEPAQSVGGDLYFGALRDDGRLAVAVGDVSGKGVGAALWMALSQGLLGMLQDLGHELSDLAPRLHRSLQKHNPGNRFLTLALAYLDPTGGFELVNAGHCPVCIRRATGGVETLPSTGPLLGLLPQGAWSVVRGRLAPGDVLIFYSDGISESTDPDEQEFETEGVTATLAASAGGSADKLALEVLDAAARHRRGHDATDDVTLVAVRYLGESAASSDERPWDRRTLVG